VERLSDGGAVGPVADESILSTSLTFYIGNISPGKYFINIAKQLL
jgi:hypothetical protein